MANKRQVLIAPLDWGLGHAARCVPLISREIEAGSEVVVAASGTIAYYLRERFPDMEFIPLEGYGIRYHERLPAWISILLRSPSVFRKIREENLWLESLLKKRHFDMVISDNRYGLWNRQVRSVLVTHQLNLCLPGFSAIFSKLVNRRIRNLIAPFDECWIPDEEGADSLSGVLSHGIPVPRSARFIGRLSRFDRIGHEGGNTNTNPFDTVILLSGPEPKRTLLEKKLVREAKSSGGKTLIIKGRPESDRRYEEGSITYWSTASDEELAFHLRSTKKIICRSGYSTLMDLISLGVKAELIPTPGQTEQEYLAKRMRDRFGWKIRKETEVR